uniref:Uncharacterized protein n=1 Tax=Anopheles maculatus TaxID=74869 RepID=A0A182SYS6_9DIPT
IFLILIVVKFGCSVHIVCEVSAVCDIHDIRTSADFFVHRYMPSTVTIAMYQNLDIGFVNVAFFSTIPSYVTTVDIKNSKHIRWLVIPGQSSVSQLNIAHTGLRRIDVEKNSVLAELFVANSNVAQISPTISNLQATRNIGITNCMIESVDMVYTLR